MNANGIKVRNMVAAFAYDRGFSVPMATTSCDVRLRDKRLLEEYEKYPGAYVPEPHKGVSLTPVIALDFASLYPSIIMAHNLSPECVLEEQDVREVQNAAPGELYDRVTLRNGQVLQCNRVTVDFEKGFNTASITAYVLAREEGVGVYPFILQSLFNMRAEVKKVLEGIDETLKELEHDRAGNEAKIKDLLYQYSLVDAKQKAIKVFMNTFYGETGNQQSSLFDVVISGGTTSYGQKYIKQVHRAVGERDCEVVAGDTDSIYFRPRAEHYSLPAEGLLSCSAMLDQANQIADRMRLFVNDMIGKQTHGFLKMAFEELLCPSVFTGKKKYFGAMYKPGDLHRDRIDVAVRGSVLVKGIDFIKSQYPELIKKHGYRLINDVLNHYNDLLKGGLDRESFADATRARINGALLNMCTARAISFLNEVKTLAPAQYCQLSSKKRMRDATGGEMAGFRQRLVPSVDRARDNKPETALAISIEELQDLNIPVPLVGEVLDIVYIKPVVFQKSLKSAEKMHLLDYAVKTNQELDFAEYLKMFATSAVRISLATHLPPNVDSVDPGSQQVLFNKAQKDLKHYFSIDALSKSNGDVIVKTVREVHMTEDIQDIRDTFTKSPFVHLSIKVKARLAALPKELLAAAKKLNDHLVLSDLLLDKLDELPDREDLQVVLEGSARSALLTEVLQSQTDSRVSFIVQKLDESMCKRL